MATSPEVTFDSGLEEVALKAQLLPAQTLAVGSCALRPIGTARKQPVELKSV